MLASTNTNNYGSMNYVSTATLKQQECRLKPNRPVVTETICVVCVVKVPCLRLEIRCLLTTGVELMRTVVKPHRCTY